MSAPGSIDRPSRALLVDAEGDLRALCVAVLTAAGHAVVVVDGPVAFAEAFAEGGFACCVVSLQPGFGDGLELAAGLRKRFPDLPLAVVGDVTTPGAIPAAVALGVLEFVPATLSGMARLVDAVSGTAVPGTAVPGTAVPAKAVLGKAVPGTSLPRTELAQRALSPTNSAELMRLRSRVSDLQGQLAQARRAAASGAGDQDPRLAELERFAAEVAHDMQEPLRTVRLHAERLGDRLARSDDDEARSLLTHIQGTTERLQEQLDNTLADAHGVDADRGGVVFTSNADRVFDEVVALLAGAIADTGGTVTRGPLAEVAIPPHQLRQILQNLIANALHHGGDPPQVHVTARPQGDAWVLSVRDNGPGIPADQREAIFRPLTRLGAGSERGHGLGLSICHKLVQRASGEISVRDHDDGGSVFEVTLPADPALADEPTVVGPRGGPRGKNGTH